LSRNPSLNSCWSSDMRAADDERAKETNQTPVFRFLAGFGVRALLGWLRVLFRGNLRRQRQHPLVSEKNYSESQAVLSVTRPEADHIRITDQEVAADSVERVRMPSTLPTSDDLVAPEPLSLNEPISKGDAAAEDETPQESNHPLAIMASQVPSDLPDEYTTGASVEPVRVLSIVPTSDDTLIPNSAPTNELISPSVNTADDKPPQQSHHSSEIMAPQVPIYISEDSTTVGSEMVVTTQDEFIDGSPTSASDFNCTDALSQERQRRDDMTGRGADSSLVFETKNPQPVHEYPARTAIHHPRPVESVHEYAKSVSDYLSPAYLQWNRWIAEQVFAPTRRNEQVYLSITPNILAGIAADYRETPVSPLEAEEEFATALRAAYASTIVQDGRLRVLRRLDAEGVPLCLAFLGISVLAAYRMQSDEETSGGAYYFRLAEILACEMVAGHPRGFDPVVFESLWVFVQAWLANRTGAHLVMPSLEVRRFVALPLTHVPLRRLDIEKLPTFFVWAGYAPGVRVPETKLLADLERWVRSYALFSSAGSSAVMDERRHAVLAQVMHELGAWDGSITESGGRRSASVQLMLDIVRQRPNLFYLPRRPDGFPAHFDDGLHVLEAADDGFYTPLQLSAGNGSELSDGFEWKGAGNVSLRRGPAALIALGPSPDYTGFLSRPNLLRGTTCAVLCEEALVRAAADYLGASVGRTCTPISHAGLPDGWRLFLNVRPTHKIDVPAGLDALNVASETDIICTGGLRLGRRREWLAGAPPKILVTGLEQNEIVRIDGAAVHTSEDGALQMDGHLLGPGVHIIDAGRAQRTIEIVEPRIGLPRSLSGFDRQVHYVTLPVGQWYVIGASPEQTTGRIEAGRPGKICKVDFNPVWAISVGGRPGANVICIPLVPVPPALAVTRKSAPPPSLRRWISIIYDAAIRRPKFASVLPNSDRILINDVWRQYARLARRTKRQWRSDR
jgi:hypothetical protein